MKIKKSTRKKVKKVAKRVKRTVNRYATKIGLRRKNPSNLYPFLWCTDVIEGTPIPKELKYGKWYVVISYLGYNYLDDPYLRDEDEVVIQPSPESVKEIYEFKTEKEALEFIQKWWSKQ